MITIEAEIRSIQGKGTSRRLLSSNKFPAIIYGGTVPPVPIELEHDKIWNLQVVAEFFSEVLSIIIGDNEEKVKVQAIQLHAFKPKLTHIDFIRA